MKFPNLGLLLDIAKIFSIYSILGTIMISSINFTRTQIFSEVIYCKIVIQKTVFMAHLSYYEFLTMTFRATMPSSLNGFDEPRTLLASSSKSRVLATRAQPGMGFAAPWHLAFSDVLRVCFAT